MGLEGYMEWVAYVCLGLLFTVLLIAIVTAKKKRTSDIHSMDGRDFEEFCAEVLESHGYRDIEFTPATGDFGADLLVTDKEGNRLAVQCKRYSRPVGVKAVQEAQSAASYYHCKKAVVMTNSTFTESAKKLALKSGVSLIDGGMLQKLNIEKANHSDFSSSHLFLSYAFTEGVEEEEILVVIDGEKRGLLPYGLSALYSLSPGEHTILVRFGRQKETMSFFTKDGETISCVCCVVKGRVSLLRFSSQWSYEG